MTETNTHYHFLPVVRRGLAAAIREKASGERAELAVRLTASASGTNEISDTFGTSVKLYGPGDILGFDPGIVTRTDPKPDVGDFEPNFFPMIEFADPDFPWRFTAAHGEDRGLTPWITLIVLETGEFHETGYREDMGTPQDPQVPWIAIRNPATLPNLNETWRWAHAQMTGAREENLDSERFDAIEDSAPERIVSRLLCARRLKPGTAYEAFVVPTFKLGCVAAGRVALEEPENAQTLSWNGNASEEVNLPYYYRWKFQTGQRGDFEYLVRLIEPRDLQGLGTRPMDCSTLGYGMAAVERANVDPSLTHILDLEGALKSIGTQFTAWGADAPPGAETPALQEALATGLLNKPHMDLSPRTMGLTLEDSGIIEDATVTLRPLFSVETNDQSVRMEARLRWTTREPAQCAVDGPTLAESGPMETAVGTSHEILLTRIRPGISRTFTITATNEEGIESIASNVVVTTPPFPLPTVVPPIYGHWHAGRFTVRQYGGSWAREDDGTWARSDPYPWIDELNLDPRHRAAAGFGALVVERQQEAMMASAWDQLGQIEEANEVLRRAQLGREAAEAIFNRLVTLRDGDFLRATAHVHRRVRVAETTVARQLGASRIPNAAFAPGLRRIRRRRGPIGRRQGTPKAAVPDMLDRLNDGTFRAAGPAPRPDGMIGVGGITEEVKQGGKTGRIEGTVLDENGNPVAGADVKLLGTPLASPTNGKGMFIIDEVPIGNYETRILLEESGAKEIGSIQVKAGETTRVERKLSPAGDEPATVVWFCEELLTGFSVKKSLGEARTLKGVSLWDEAAVPEIGEALIAVLDDWLGATPAPRPEDEAPVVDLKGVTDVLRGALDPRNAVPQRTKKRLHVAHDVFQGNDPLDPAIASPAFPQPMYEPLREISQDLILPGVERVPQNTLALLKTNRRFLEAYMAAINHAFTGELLWRGAPVTGRATYFRQFWDVGNYVPTEEELDQYLKRYLAERNVEEISAEERERLLERYERTIEDAPGLSETQKNNLAEALLKEELLAERLKDIPPLHEWRDGTLGGNHNRDPDEGEHLVLLIRGDLLKKYPDTLVYAVPAVGSSDNRDPALPEFVGDEAAPPIFPVFSGSLPPDLYFFGFPLKTEDARGETEAYPEGVYFVLEERVSETRFGMDVAKESPAPPLDWDDLNWGHIDVSAGEYVNEKEPTGPTDGSGEPDWSESAAAIAYVTAQKPVRIAVHADQMLPEQPNTNGDDDSQDD